MFPKLKHVLAATMVVTALPLMGLQAIAADKPERPAMRHGGAPHGFMMGKQLNLTDAQKAQMKAIAQKYRGEAGKAEHKAQREKLKALLTAPKVDGAALRAYFDAQRQSMEAGASKRASMMTEMRAVLTAEQRAQALKSLTAERPEGKKRDKAGKNDQGKARGERGNFADRLTKDLKLTAAQKQKVEALKAKMQANAAERKNRPDPKAAMAKFIETGDAAAFQSTMRGGFARQLPTNELVALAESLDQAQRQQLLKKLDRFGPGKRGHGEGRGHHGGGHDRR